VLTIAGGKLTTWRSMAAELVDQVENSLGHEHRGTGKALSKLQPLPGGEAAILDGFKPAGAELGLSPTTVEHLLRHFGTEAPAIYALCRERPELTRPIHPDHPAIAGAVVQAVRRELALRVDDVLTRRLHLSTETADQGRAAIPAVAALMASELGWSADFMAAEMARAEAALLAGSRWRGLS
jgi:glycerol-3-phosphate dehydrogenase